MWIALIFAALFAMSSAVRAHHGWSEYDSGKPLTLTGTIEESGYEHPHGHVRLAAKERTWLVILAPPTRMTHRGLPATALKNGVQATVVGYPNRNRHDEMRAERITVSGKTVELR